MSLEPLNNVIHSLKKTHWKEQQAFQKLLDEWSEIVGPSVSAQTTPLTITPKRVLQVATSSGVWAHNLSFERKNLLKKINDRFKLGLKDIFFTTSQWGRSTSRAFVPDRGEPIDLSKVRQRRRPERDMPTDPQSAFERWADTIQSRSQRLDICPVCECPTPQTELDRWDMCSLCVAREQFGSSELFPGQGSRAEVDHGLP